MKSASIFLSVLFSCLFVTANAANEADSGNAAYAKGDYARAAALYEKALSDEIEAPELYYNLGNSYFKDGKTGLAILNYERALRLSPGDAEIKANLQFAMQKTEDKIEPAPEMFLDQWKNATFGLMTEASWSLLCIVSFALALAFFSVYLLAPGSRLKKLGFFSAPVPALLFVCSFFIARGKAAESLKHDDAIIVAPTVTVTGSPAEKGTRLFILHEGTKVKVEEQEGDWSEIRLANGKTGWIKGSEMEII